jgi:uncharacterized protein (TIGR00369 family)
MEKSLTAEGHVTSNATMPVNECFGCGPGNPTGMQLQFFYEGEQAVCDFNLPKRYEGPPGHCHGGIIATILDEAMGKVNKLRDVVALTKSMEIDYMRPVPLYTDLRAIGWEQKVNGRVHINAAEIRNAAGEVLARSHGVFIAIDPKRMFADHLPEGH